MTLRPLSALALLALLPTMTACDEASGASKSASSSSGGASSGGSSSGGATSGVGGQVSGTGAAGGQSNGVSQAECDTSGATAMVSLTYDDALPSQLVNAAPALEAHKLRATFFLTNVTGSGLTSWGALKEKGHELASHTLNHPCPKANTWVAAGNANEDYDAERMATELDDNIAQLEAMGQKGPFTFAYPCGIDWIGAGQQSYVDLVKERFTAARGVNSGLVTALGDAFHVPAYFLTGTGDTLISVVDSAIAKHAWAVFGFHGVGGDHSPVSNEAHEALLAYLEQQGPAVRVLPFGAAALCMKQR